MDYLRTHEQVFTQEGVGLVKDCISLIVKDMVFY